MPKNYLEYNRPTPYSTDNGVRVTSGVTFGDRNPLIKPRRAQKRKGHLTTRVVKPDGTIVKGKRISKATACVHLGLWKREPIKVKKPKMQPVQTV